jgi:hypothetical protein
MPMPTKVPTVERRSRIVCHFPMNRMPSPIKPNQMRVIHEFIRFLKKTGLTGFTTSSLYENTCTGYWRAATNQEFAEENVVLICIDHVLDKSDPELWNFIAEMKREIQKLYERYADQKEEDVWIVVHAIDRLV